MVAVPAPIPVTKPVDPTVATKVLLLPHVPPPVASVRVVVEFTHTFNVPVITAGRLLTVTTACVIQVVGKV